MSRKALTVGVLCALFVVIAVEYVIFPVTQRTGGDSVKFDDPWHYVGNVVLTGAAMVLVVSVELD